ncbi:MAG: PAS domain-containing protein [Leptospirales bacterium]
MKPARANPGGEPDVRGNQRRSLLSILTVSLSLAALVLAVYNVFDAREQILVRQETALVKEAGVFAENVRKFATDARVVADMISAARDPITAGGSLERKLFAFARQRHAYDQTRLLAADGREVIRIDDGPEGPRLTPVRLLQDKGHREYFLDSVGMNGGVRISPITWNEERGKIQIPRVPMIRFSAPVIRNNRIVGVVVLNYNARTLQRRLEESQNSVTGPVCMVSDAGRVLLNDPDRDDTIGPERVAALEKMFAALGGDRAVRRLRTASGLAIYAPIPLYSHMPASWRQVEQWGLIVIPEAFLWSIPSIIFAALALLAFSISGIFALNWLRSLRQDAQRLLARRESENQRLTDRGRELEAANAELRRLERRSRVMRDIASAANAATDAGEAYERTMRIISEEFAWTIGHLYVVESEGERLTSSGLWCVRAESENAERAAAEFRAVTGKTDFNVGVGLPGRVWRDRRGEWIKNITADHISSPRGEKLGTNTRIRSGFAFPIIVEDRIEAVMEFFTVKEREAETELLNLTNEIGQELGYVVLRKRVEANLVANEAILHETQALAGLGTWEFQPETKRVTWSPQTFRLLGFPEGTTEVPGYEEHIQTVHPDDRPVLNSRLDDLAKTGRPYDLIVRYFTVDNRLIWTNVQGRAV